jgi:tRNA-uridine 2-sulfurtransferase
MKVKNQKNKVLVAMSGGVDSSVAAALLKNKGYEVIGAFMKFWSPEGKKAQNKCCSSESETRARQVAKILGIPFYIFNFEKKFKKEIVDSFLKEYKAGNTPNPCVVCNKLIKFGVLLNQAKNLGADFLATGHYSRLFSEGRLAQAKDKNKDQSYFLWKLSQDQLKHILFPIGNYTRAEVEKMAEDLKLPFSGVKKSMEICFVPKTTEEFLKEYLKPKSGKIIEIEPASAKASAGKVIGQHKGLSLYTIGQRKGMELAGGPYYVVSKNQKKNELAVSKNKKDLLKKEIFLKDVNWLSGKPPKLPLKAKVKIRYRSPSALAVIFRLDAKRYKLIFTKFQRAVTPGQSAVFYLPRRSQGAKAGEGEELLGGGIII